MYNPGWMRVGLYYGLLLPRVASSHRTAAHITLGGYQDGITRLQKFESSSLMLLSSHGNTLFKAGWGNTFLYENQTGFSSTFLQTNRRATSQLYFPIPCSPASQWSCTAHSPAVPPRTILLSSQVCRDKQRSC